VNNELEGIWNESTTPAFIETTYRKPWNMSSKIVDTSSQIGTAYIPIASLVPYRCNHAKVTSIMYSKLVSDGLQV
jgi:hypothetical protein